MGIFHGADSLLTLCEHGASNDPRNKNVISAGGILTSAGLTLTQAGFMIPTVTSGYFYSSEVINTNLYANGARVVVPCAGCRPRTRSNGSYAWQSGSAGTAYINRFSDGEVWVSGTANSRSGSQLSYKLAQTSSLPRGVRYLIVQVVGGGGGGSYRGLGGGTSGCGGSSAIGICMIKLPENGYATLVVGSAGAGSSATMGDGFAGGDSKITCGSFYLTAGGGQPGKYGAFGGSGGAAGTISTSGDNADGRVIISHAGNAGSAGAIGGSYSVAYTDWAPEGGTFSFVSAAGGPGGTSAYASGSAGAIGDVIISY